MVIHDTLDASLILDEVQELEKAVQSILPGRVPDLALEDWRSRLQKLRDALVTTPGQKTNFEETPGRVPRGLINAVGSFASWAFGTATFAEIQEVQQVMDVTRKESRVGAHVVDKLTSVVNTSREYIIENRRRLNEVSRLVEQLEEARNLTVTLFKHFYNVRTQLDIDRVISHVEREYRDFQVRERQNQRQKASLELGRLTEDLLPLPTLREILETAASEDTIPVDPIEWYYQFAQLTPLWDESLQDLIYKTELPLVRPVPYLGYDVHTYEVPYVNSTTTVRLQAQGQFGLDTQNGDIFKPSGCKGENPIVCKTGPLYQSHGLACARAVISGRLTSNNCNVQVNDRPNSYAVVLADNSPSNLVIMSWGEAFVEHCTGQAKRTYEVTAGTYLVKIRGGCILKSTVWSIRAIIEKKRTYVHKMSVVITQPFKLLSLIPKEYALLLTKSKIPHFTELGKVASVPLELSNKELDGVDTALMPVEWKSGQSWPYLIFLTCVIVVTTSISFFLFCWLKKPLPCKLCKLCKMFNVDTREGGQETTPDQEEQTAEPNPLLALLRKDRPVAPAQNLSANVEI